MRLATWELRMNRPRARAGLTPIICRVRIADEPPAEPVLGVGGGDPCIGAGGAAIIRVAAASGACGAGGEAVAVRAPAAAGAPVAARRCGSLALCESRSLTDCR